MNCRKLFCLMLLLVMGCSGGDEGSTKHRETYPASGVVTMNGTPVGGVSILLRLKTDDISASAVSSKDGSFQLTTYEENDGAVEGEYDIVVYKNDSKKPSESADSKEVDTVSESNITIPVKYTIFEQSGLTTTITPEGSNTIELALESK